MYQISLLVFVILSFTVNLTKEVNGSIAAVVNKKVISQQDLNNRIQFAILSSGLEDNAETRQMLKKRVLDILIVEELQLQKVKEFSIYTTKQEIEQGIVRIEKQNNMHAAELKKILQEHNLPYSLIQKQVEASIVWQDYISAKYRNSAVISAREVKAELQKNELSQKEDRYRLGEIIIKFNKEDKDQNSVYQEALAVIEQINNGAPFHLLAQQISQAPSAVLGGNIGWIAKSNLDNSLQEALEKLDIGECTSPILINNSYRILYLYKKLRAGEYDAPQDFISFTRVIVKTPKDAFEFELKDKIAQVKSIAKNIKSSKQIKDFVGKDAHLHNVYLTPVDALPLDLQKLLSKLKIGHATEPIYTSEGIVFFVLADRKTYSHKMPSSEMIKEQLIEKKLHLYALQEMHRLKKLAHINNRHIKWYR